MSGTERSPDSRFDGVSDCLTCDRVNVSNAVHGVLQLVSCGTNDVDTLEEAFSLVEDEARSLHTDSDRDDVPSIGGGASR